MGYEGSSLHNQLREVNSSTNDQIIHALSNEPLEFFADRRQTVQTSTIHIVNLVSTGVQHWRTYIQQSGQQLLNTDPALFEFPNVVAS